MHHLQGRAIPARLPIARVLVYSVLVAVWACVCFVQVGLVRSRLFVTSPDGWLPWNHIAGVILVYLPVGLAAAATWLTRTMNLGMVVIAHIVALAVSLLFWVL